jgi:hypothetical protein
MTWRDQLVARILLIVARMFADDPRVAEDIKNLATHISVNAPKVAA